MLAHARLNRAIIHVLLYVLLSATTLVALFPVIYIFLASFKSNQELLAGGVGLLPRQFTLANYVNAWKAANFSRYTFNSLFFTGTVTAVTVLFSTMMGYCFQRKSFPGKRFMLGTFYFSMFVAGAVTIYPVFMLVVQAELHRTLLGLILATLGGSSILTTLLVIGYLKGIPKELDESAIIDGCGVFGVYARILLPVITPVVGVVTLITFQGTWNSYMLPLALTLTSPDNRPLSVGVTSLAYVSGPQGGMQWDLLIAGSCMSIIPIAVVYLWANRFFISGITAGALKG
ncbi:carbohydrate ABC transporter permease [Paenibacillus sp. IB182496]|uniref:Carbohydrate ABC transporter permease n=1 Tax=Paenibacillus sabuli TaxID=2772509 RepID=A0A927BUU8_9BACL|nr:carbohydrate ABC transporter permease [Paenibacillus sabuli]MBD2846306.1 carbohydrate ABC transporter permease [Paenibacillus sabuli]